MSGDTINNYFAAPDLTDEEVWLRAWCATSAGLMACPGLSVEAGAVASFADQALTDFRERFPKKIEAKRAETV